MFVEETFLIAGRGLVVVGAKENSIDLKIGSKVEVLCPDGTKISSKVSAIEIIERRCFSEHSEKENIAFILKNLTKENIPKGSVVIFPN